MLKTRSTAARRRFLTSAAIALAAPMIAAPLAGAVAQDAPAEVAKAVEALRVAMLAGDGQALRALTMDQLTYGHSNSRLEDRAAFVASLEGKTAFKTLDLSDQAIQVVGDAAVVRHTFDAINNLADGKTSTAHIKVLQVWKRDGGAWKLLARQAAPLPA